MIHFDDWGRLRNAVVLTYSAAIMATTLPGFNAIPHIVVLPYYFILPGYVTTLVVRQAQGIIQTIFFSVIWSVTILASVYSLIALAPGLSSVPLSGLVPIPTIIMTVYAYYHGR